MVTSGKIKLTNRQKLVDGRIVYKTESELLSENIITQADINKITALRSYVQKRQKEFKNKRYKLTVNFAYVIANYTSLVTMMLAKSTTAHEVINGIAYLYFDGFESEQHKQFVVGDHNFTLEDVVIYKIKLIMKIVNNNSESADFSKVIDVLDVDTTRGIIKVNIQTEKFDIAKSSNINYIVSPTLKTTIITSIVNEMLNTSAYTEYVLASTVPDWKESTYQFRVVFSKVIATDLIFKYPQFYAGLNAGTPNPRYTYPDNVEVYFNSFMTGAVQVLEMEFHLTIEKRDTNVPDPSTIITQL